MGVKMEKKIKTGVLLIVAALCIGGIFLWQTYQGRDPGEQGEEQLAGREEKTAGKEFSKSSASGAVASPDPEPSDTQEPSPDPAGDPWIEVNPDILQFLAVTEEEFADKLRVYANQCGCGAAEKAGDLGEMIVDYGEKTVTIPCYFKTGKAVEKFDVVFYTEKRRYRFVPW